MILRRPFDRLSLDLIDKSNKPSYKRVYNIVIFQLWLISFILVMIDKFSRYIFCYSLISKSPSTTSIALEKFFNDLEATFPNHEPIRFMHMDNGTEFFYQNSNKF